MKKLGPFRFTRIHTNAMGLSGLMFLLAIISMLILDKDDCTRGNVLSMVVGALAGGFLTFTDAADESGDRPDRNGSDNGNGNGKGKGDA